MSARLRFHSSMRLSGPKRRAHAWLLAGLGLLAAGTSCGPIAKSTFKTNRFAAPTDREETTTAASEPSSSGPAQPTHVTPVLEVRKPLPITYITRVLDAASMESVRLLMADTLELPEAPSASPSAPAPAPSPVPSASATGNSSSHDASRLVPVSAISETHVLNEEQLEALQSRGSVELNLPELPVGMSPSKVIGIFHVIQNDEFELLEEDEGFKTELELFKSSSGYQGTLKTHLDPVQDQQTASTLSRTVRVELEVEATLLGPVTGTPKTETASGLGTVSVR